MGSFGNEGSNKIHVLITMCFIGGSRSAPVAVDTQKSEAISTFRESVFSNQKALPQRPSTDFSAPGHNARRARRSAGSLREVGGELHGCRDSERAGFLGDVAGKR